MFFEIPLRTNLFNWTQSVSVGPASFVLRVRYLSRKETYFLDILSDDGRVLEAGLPCAVGVQLNRNIVDVLPGVLFFQSVDKSISYSDRLGLGEKVKLFYYFREEE